MTAASLLVAATNTATITGAGAVTGTLTVAKTIALPASTTLTVAVGGVLDMNESGSAITLAAATSKVTLTGAVSNSAKIDFSTVNSAKTDVVSGITADHTTINATGSAAFKLGAADTSGDPQTDTTLASATTIKSFTAAAAAKDTTIQGYGSGGATLSAAATFVKSS